MFSEKNIQKLNSIYGHPQALAQCRNWLSKNLPRAKIIETESSAKAAQLIKNKSGKIWSLFSLNSFVKKWKKSSGPFSLINPIKFMELKTGS